MIVRYAYTVAGVGRKAVPWHTSGDVETPVGELPLAVARVVADTFQKLAEGRAEYGNLGSCLGPYTVQELTLRRVD